MRNAYALLGLAFLIVFGSAYILFERAHAPTIDKDLEDLHSETSMSLTLTSPAFTHNGSIPPVYTCDGENMLPPLAIENVPEGTESFVLVMDDPDIPEEVKATRSIEKFDHFARYNIPADTTTIEAGALPGEPALNGRGDTEYIGPCPPTAYEPAEHRYIFRLYALPERLEFQKTPTLDAVEDAARNAMIEQAELIGRYERITN